MDYYKYFYSCEHYNKDVKVPQRADLELVCLDEEQQQFNQLVFAPDPVTGNPTSVVAFMLSGADEGFKQYVKDKLLKAVPNGSMADSAEEAMDCIKPNCVSIEQYHEFMQDYVRNQMVVTE